MSVLYNAEPTQGHHHCVCRNPGDGARHQQAKCWFHKGMSPLKSFLDIRWWISNDICWPEDIKVRRVLVSTWRLNISAEATGKSQVPLSCYRCQVWLLKPQDASGIHRAVVPHSCRETFKKIPSRRRWTPNTVIFFLNGNFLWETISVESEWQYWCQK